MLKWFLGGLLAVVLAIVALIYHRPIIDFMSPPEDLRKETLQLLDSEDFKFEIRSPKAIDYKVKIVHFEGVEVQATFSQSDDFIEWDISRGALPVFNKGQESVLIETGWIEALPREKFTISLQAERTRGLYDESFDTADVRLEITKRTTRPSWLRKAMAPIDRIRNAVTMRDNLEDFAGEGALDQIMKAGDALESVDDVEREFFGLLAGLEGILDAELYDNIDLAAADFEDLRSRSEFDDTATDLKAFIEQAGTVLPPEDYQALNASAQQLIETRETIAIALEFFE